MLHAMVMAGGGGTRFWPRSRAARPKQFLSFDGDRTLLQGTLDRIESQVPSDRVWVVTSAAHRDEALQQLPDVPAAQIVGEPMGRDTAACIGLGAALIANQDPAATIIVMPADHAIEPAQEFRRAVHAAAQLADEFPDALITFGIPPAYPATGYGYIHRGELAEQRLGENAFQVRQFREKPNETTAEGYVASGEYFWNSGIFVWKAATILGELKRLSRASTTPSGGSPTPGPRPTATPSSTPSTRPSEDQHRLRGHGEAKRVLVEGPYQWDDVGAGWP